jgi:excisionase family DNA binding protein
MRYYIWQPNKYDRTVKSSFMETSQRIAWGLYEIAKATGLSLAFLRNEVRAGRLPVRRFGRRVLVRNEDLESYLEQGGPHIAAAPVVSDSDERKDRCSVQSVDSEKL